MSYPKRLLVVWLVGSRFITLINVSRAPTPIITFSKHSVLSIWDCWIFCFDFLSRLCFVTLIWLGLFFMINLAYSLKVVSGCICPKSWECFSCALLHYFGCSKVLYFLHKRWIHWQLVTGVSLSCTGSFYFVFSFGALVAISLRSSHFSGVTLCTVNDLILLIISRKFFTWKKNIYRWVIFVEKNVNLMRRANSHEC